MTNNTLKVPRGYVNVLQKINSVEDELYVMKDQMAKHMEATGHYIQYSGGYSVVPKKKCIKGYAFALWLIITFVAMLVILSLTLTTKANACDRYPVAPGDLIREYMLPNGLMYREYDEDKNGEADWGTASRVLNGVVEKWPLFYAAGFDDPGMFNDAEHPFVAMIVWRDKQLNGNCADIVEEFVRRDKKPLNMDTPEKKLIT